MSTGLTSLDAWRERREHQHASRFDLRQLFASDASRIALLERLVPHRTFLGKRPSGTRALDGMIALHEHKVFKQSVIWGINVFDQWGVELGKQLAHRILPELAPGVAIGAHDSSTNGLIEYTRSKR